MPFTHKYPRLFAMTPSQFLATCLSLTQLACTAGEATNSEDSDFVGLSVYPSQARLSPEQTQHFKAYGYTSLGDSVLALVNWSTTGGQVEPGCDKHADDPLGGGLLEADIDSGLPCEQLRRELGHARHVAQDHRCLRFPRRVLHHNL